MTRLCNRTRKVAFVRVSGIWRAVLVRDTPRKGSLSKVLYVTSMDGSAKSIFFYTTEISTTLPEREGGGGA
jgi:hypothetical protein